ncbi:protein serine/threonine phosphatase 2C [Pleomassaria siparia CBS 279.74]|uniref:Protein phosphatase n=1 Tax=Pleomassaria siparia CBS 279.74 TaxID=1314801 RepID=A0A6G1K4W3_9PLEO|nr:protein serine/threonine phosphatase 2C [Pleomassaria siparia CBS 279.74]
MTPVPPWSHCFFEFLAQVWAAMSFAFVGARTTHAHAHRAPSSNLFLLYLSASSIFAPATSTRTGRLHSQRTLYSPPTCPLNRDSCPTTSGLRNFHSSSHTWKSTPQFSYHVAASYSAKGDRFNAESNLFTGGVFDPTKSSLTMEGCNKSLNKQKRPKSGQDSFFFSQVGTTKTTTFGVADGVGGWTESGIDPADFSHGLCEYMACAARSWPLLQGKTSSLHPKNLLQLGYDEVIKDESIVGGGSTACLAVAESDGNVEVANLGDSGFMHLGLNAVRHFTQPQTHAFNTPFQISKTPKRMLVQMAVFGGPTALSDPPNSSSITHHRVRHGDVLLFATDGVWDNLSTQDALSIVSRNMIETGAWVEKDGALDVGPELAKLTQATSDRKADSSSLQARLAVAVAREAKETSLNTRRDGPFAKEVQKYYPGENWHGGKPDDIAALVAVVVEDS